MAYTKTTWVDRVVQYPNRYDKTNESSSQVTLTASPGTVTTAGTALNATALNNLEKQYDEAVNEIMGTKEITLLAIYPEYTRAGTSYLNLYTLFLWNANFAKNKSVYFEAVFRTDTPATGYVELYNQTDSTSVTELTTTVISSTSNDQRVRSSALTLTDGKLYTVRIKTSTSTENVRIRSARLIIL